MDTDQSTPPHPFEALAALVAGATATDRAKALGAAIDMVPELQTWLRQARQRAVVEMYEVEGVGSYTDIGNLLGFTRGRAQQIASGYVGGRAAAKKSGDAALEAEGEGEH